MKKIIVFCFYLSVLASCVKIQDTQYYNYNLKQDELERVLGVYLQPDVNVRFGVQTYSWGEQSGPLDTGVVIDYAPDLAVLAGNEYSNYLILSDDGLIFLVKEMKKTGEGKYKLDLVLLVNVPLYKPKNAGAVTLTLLDNRHMLIDTSSSLISSWGGKEMLWKCAGPQLMKEVVLFPDLPDAEL